MEKREKPTRETTLREIRRILAYDEALAKMYDAGIGDEFLTAVTRNKELMEAISKIAPSIGPIAADWSCCVTVSDPLRRPGKDVILPTALKGK
jgi:hypothetical protein